MYVSTTKIIIKNNNNNQDQIHYMSIITEFSADSQTAATSKGRFHARLTLCLYSSIHTSATLRAFLFMAALKSGM